MDASEYRPGEPAPRVGRYEELNVFGTPTGKIVNLTELQRFPTGPRGFSWRPAEKQEC
jgi:hypothetical protein